MPLVFDPVTGKWYNGAAIADATDATLAAASARINQILAVLREAGIVKPT